MEAKRSRPAGMATLCVLLLVLLPGEVAAKSKFCKCFDDCFPGCTNDDVPRLLCKVFCTNKCSPNQAASGGDGMCRMACNKLDIEICGWSAAPADGADAASCVENCNKKWSQN